MDKWILQEWSIIKDARSKAFESTSFKRRQDMKWNSTSTKTSDVRR